MSNFEFEELPLKGAYLITGFYNGDFRGGFLKCFEEEVYKQAGISFHVSETFVSKSSQNVIRGLHFQMDHPQAKLVSVIEGRAWDVIVDLRLNSPTFGEWNSVELEWNTHKAVFIPKGFAHGFLSRADGTVMLYQCDGPYDGKTDTGIRYDDPDLNIKWPIELTDTIHSERDMSLPGFKDYLKHPICDSIG